MENFYVKEKESGKIYNVMNYEPGSDNTVGYYLLAEIPSGEMSRILETLLTEKYKATTHKEAFKLFKKQNE